jgi:hypothetical protein
MKFDELFPNVMPLGQADYQQAFIFRSKKLGICCICGAETTWCDGDFEDFVCSPECDEHLWEMYFAALEKGEEIE